MNAETNIPPRVLVVDDEPRNVRLLESLLKHEGVDVHSATSGEAALEELTRFKPDLILLDIMMPFMDGHEVAARIKADPATASIPIIVVTSLDDRASRLAALKAGAEDFLSKPIDRAELSVRVRNLLRLKHYGDTLASYSRELERRVDQRTAQLTASYRQTIATLTRAATYRDEETGAHVQRISHFCVELAAALGLDATFCDAILHASPLHDIGKIAIPDRILLKAGSLDTEEWEIMKTHAALGAKMLAGGDSIYLHMGREIALSHHERWDGSGYPEGRAGEAIPLAARIMSVADVYDALRSRRAYKPALEHRTALQIITRGDGRTSPAHFDPAVLAALDVTHERLEEIYSCNSERDVFASQS